MYGIGSMQMALQGQYLVEYAPFLNLPYKTADGITLNLGKEKLLCH